MKASVKKNVRSSKQQGQILVLTALMSTTLIIMFGMVLSIGHLIQAKINLQNATDLAALSGASQQARNLNMISLVNYRLRQNYKFLLYDLYVTQSRFNPQFENIVGRNALPGLAPANSKISFADIGSVFGICQQSYDYQPVPGVDDLQGGLGTGADAQTSMCQRLGSLPIPPVKPIIVAAFSPPILAMIASMKSLSNQMKQICSNSAGQNASYFKYIVTNYKRRQDYHMLQLNEMIKAFNNAFQDDGVISGSGPADQAVLKTFQNNLIGANAQSKIEYINSDKNRKVTIDYFEETAASFNIRVANFVNTGAGCEITSETKTSSTIGIPGLKNGLIQLGLAIKRVGGIGADFGVPQIPLNIVVKATVRPSILFWPKELTPTLVAVSAAKPFGSRIGPTQKQSNLEIYGREQGAVGSNPDIPVNMSFYPGDVTGPTDSVLSGIGHVRVLRSIYQSLKGSRFSNGATVAGLNLNRPSITNFNPRACLDPGPSGPDFMCMTLAPTLYESLFFNAFPFPPQIAGKGGMSTTKALESIFPWEYQKVYQSIPLGGISGADPAYYLKDREVLDPGLYSSNNFFDSAYQLWHTTVYIGGRGDGNNIFGDGSKAMFFGDLKSVLSSWSPTVNTADLGNSKTDRMGYQIKLVSLKQVCNEIQLGGKSQVSGILNAYCSESPDTGVFL